MAASIPQGSGGEAIGSLPASSPELEKGTATDLPDAHDGDLDGVELGDAEAGIPWNLIFGWGLTALALVVYVLIHINHTNGYLHFVLQAQAWLNGDTSIPMPQYQDVQPILDVNGMPTGRGIIPFPPLPAWFLVPFVAFWHDATDQIFLSAVFGAVDLGLVYWLLGRLPIAPAARTLTALFIGFGTVLLYSSAIGTTWFFAHIIAVGCLLLSMGCTLIADPEATSTAPLREARGAVRGASVPGGWLTAGVVILAGILAETFLVLAGSKVHPALLALIGVAIGLVAAVLVVAVSGRARVLGLAAAILGTIVIVPGVFLLAALAPAAALALDAILVVMVLAGGALAARRNVSADAIADAFGALARDAEALQVAAGLLFGLAVMARLTVVFGFPFLMLVGGGGTWMRRTLLAGAGAMIPLTALLVVTYATTGQLFNPAYDYQYQAELLSYGSVLNYNASYAISDIRYVPQNLMIMLFQGPEIAPPYVGIFGPGSGPDWGTPACTAANAARGLFDATCPLAMPNAVGMGLLLTSPAYLVAPLALGPLARLRIDRATVGATIAVLAIAFVDLTHFSQGWVQFGYRFSNDFMPFAAILVALGASRLGRLWPFALLVVLSIVVNFWGTIWGIVLGW